MFTLVHNAITGVGKRSQNEDCYYPKPSHLPGLRPVFLVCDGVGGNAFGEIASSLACTTIAAAIVQLNDQPISLEGMAWAVDQAVEAIGAYVTEKPEAATMATTLTMLVVDGSNTWVAHMGDSRIYQFRAGKIIFKTLDHNLLSALTAKGILSAEEAANHPKKNVITKALQAGINAEPDIAMLEDVQAGDYFFMCTDGVTESVSDTVMNGIFGVNDTPEKLLQQIATICEKNSRDNYTAQLILVSN